MKITKYTISDFNKQMDSRLLSNDIIPSNFIASGNTLRTVSGYSRFAANRIVDNGNIYRITDIFVCNAEAVSSNERYDKLIVSASKGNTRGLFSLENGNWVKLQGNISECGMGAVSTFFNNEKIMLAANAYDGVYTYAYGENELGYIDNAPGMSSIVLHHERIWGTGSYEEPNAVYYSTESDINGWDTVNGKLTVTTADGDMFLAVQNVFDDIVLYRKHSLFRIMGTQPENYRLEEIPASNGAAGVNSIANNGIYSFYAADDGLYFYNGVKAELVKNELISRLFEQRVNKAYMSGASAIIFGNKLYVALPVDNSDVNNFIIEYDIQSGDVTFRSGIGIKCFGVYKSKLLFANYDGYINELDGTDSYNGSDIEMKYLTEYSDLGTKNILKALDSVMVAAKGTGVVRLTVESDINSAVTDIELTNANKFVNYRRDMYLEGRFFRFVLENISGATFEIMKPEFVFEEFDED